MPSTSGASTTTGAPSRRTMPPPGSSLVSRMAASMPGSGRPIDPGRMSAPARLAIMIPPVSVCHQLSCAGRPRCSAVHTTASGLRGSPTLATKRSALRSRSWARSLPERMSIRIAVGDVYQTVTCCSSSVRYQRVASKSRSSTRLTTPWVSGAMTP